MAAKGGRLGGFRRLLHRITNVQRLHGISIAEQWREYRRFRRFGIDRASFYGYWLWDVRRPLPERLSIMSNVERRAIEYRMNPRDENLKVRNKAVATSRLEDAGVPVGEVLTLLTLRPGVRPTSDRYPFGSDEAAVRRLLASAPAEGLVIKPEDGGSGRSVHVFRSATPEGLVALDGTAWGIDRFLAVLRSEALWKIERRLLQHPALATIAGETLGTLRLVTFRTLDGVVHELPPVWKIPIGLSGLDHFSHGEGALVAEIDVERGMLGPARRWIDDAHVDRHPLTGQWIRGQMIPHWPAAREMAVTIANCFPELGSLAYDVAISANGPVVIEVNPCWGERPTQAAGPTGIVQGMFRHFLEERGYGDVVDFAGRDGAR